MADFRSIDIANLHRVLKELIFVSRYENQLSFERIVI
mgnify:CR=1 FL=1